MPEAREGLKLRASLVEHAESLKAKAATRAGLNVDSATFVGIHNRRTDYLEHYKLISDATLVDQVYFNKAFEIYR